MPRAEPVSAVTEPEPLAEPVAEPEPLSEPVTEPSGAGPFPSPLTEPESLRVTCPYVSPSPTSARSGYIPNQLSKPSPGF